jgi:hypothetical protein
VERVRIGCSGWSYDEWRGRLYPEGLPSRRWLERYAEVFDTVEVNATFYRLQKEKTVRDWAESCRGTSSATTTCSPPPSTGCRPPTTASSSATRVGSRGRCANWAPANARYLRKGLS